MDNAAALPREIGSIDHRYQYISRFLGNTHIDKDKVMQAYAGDIFRRQREAGETIVLALEQSKINESTSPVGDPIPLLLELVPTGIIEFIRHPRYPIN